MTLFDVQVEVLLVVEVVVEQVARCDYATLTLTLLDVQVEVLVVEVAADQVVHSDYATLTLLVVQVEVLVEVAAYRLRCVFRVGCVIDPFVALLVIQVEVIVEVVAYRYRFVSLVGCAIEPFVVLLECLAASSLAGV